MASKSGNTLKKSLDLLRRGKADKARPMLVELLRKEPNNAQAWFLLSHALTDPLRQQYALQQALRADPQFVRALHRLQTLRGEPLTDPKPKETATTPVVFESPEIASPPPTFFSEDEETEGNLDNLRETESLRPEPAPEAGRARSGVGRNVLFGALVVLVAVAAFFAANAFLPTLTAQRPTTTVIASRTLPPTWTPFFEVTSAAGAQTTPTTQAFAPLGAAIVAQMEAIQTEVNGIRGIENNAEVANAIIPVNEAALILANLYLDQATAEDLTQQEMLLVALGLIPADYHLTDYALSSRADYLGGFYISGQDRVAIIGEGFSGVSPFVYAHEYGHALLDQNFELSQVSAGCRMFSDECRAVNALVEGDATLVSAQWLEQSSDSELAGVVGDYHPDPMLISSQLAPEFILQDIAFPSSHGLEFAQEVFAVGGWEQMDLVYADPPSSSEQILHPEKFFLGEDPVALEEPNLGSVLGQGWSSLENGTLGEWVTYLLLGHGAQEDAQLSEALALQAAAGWGGDQIQAYIRESDGGLAFAVHWVMDSAQDGQQLVDALERHLAIRFPDQANDLGNGQCWMLGAQRTCLFANGSEVLWLLAPDEIVVLQVMLAQYPQFQ